MPTREIILSLLPIRQAAHPALRLFLQLMSSAKTPQSPNGILATQMAQLPALRPQPAVVWLLLLAAPFPPPQCGRPEVPLIQTQPTVAGIPPHILLRGPEIKLLAFNSRSALLAGKIL